jgi:prephenate dehydrogenase
VHSTLKLPAVHWKKVSLIGVGLLGGSLGMALRRRKLASEVVGFVRRRASVRECEEAGAVDGATLSLRAAVTGADLVVLCTPLGQMPRLFEQMLPFLGQGTIVTDVGSVKAMLVRELEPLAARRAVHIVGSHPMAGSEKTGVKASRADLYQEAVTVVTPTPRTDPDALEKVISLWQNVGSRVLSLDPEEHDRFVSLSSHLPHLVAACLADLVLDPQQPSTQAALCANGFRDCTRVASGSPAMWTDISIANRKHIDSAFGKLIRDLQDLRRLLKRADAAGISKKLESAKQRRDQWQRCASSASPE